MTPIERLGIEIVDAGITWTNGMRDAWELAKDVETQCRELLNRAANELGMSPHPEAKALYAKIDDALMDMFYEDGEEPDGADAHRKNRNCIYYGKRVASSCACAKAPNADVTGLAPAQENEK